MEPWRSLVFTRFRWVSGSCGFGGVIDLEKCDAFVHRMGLMLQRLGCRGVLLD